MPFGIVLSKLLKVCVNGELLLLESDVDSLVEVVHVKSGIASAMMESFISHD